MTDQTQITLTAPRSVNMALIVGPADEILHVVQDAFASRITVRGDTVELVGDPLEVQSLTALFSDLIKLVEGGGEPTLEYVRHAIDLLRTAEFSPQALREDILLTYRGRAIRPKTAGQKRYVDAIREHTITFGIGPAGTGKTYLAMAMAVAALKRKEVGRIILTRPVVEAGESLGFLPGTLTEKVDPYIRPLYDALFDMTDMERATQLVESGVIEIAPLAFMRGRTLNDSFIILDEAQNTTSSSSPASTATGTCASTIRTRPSARTEPGTWTRCSARRRRCGPTGWPEDAGARAGNASSPVKHGKRH